MNSMSPLTNHVRRILQLEFINTEVAVEDMVVDPAASKNSAEVADSPALASDQPLGVVV